jgi:hypothetical protein
MHSELHSPTVNHPSAQRPVLPRKKMQNCHPGAQRPVLPRKKNAELSHHRQTDKAINIVGYN